MIKETYYSANLGCVQFGKGVVWQFELALYLAYLFPHALLLPTLLGV
jgi:hypothetical protein